ncbi:MAG: zinc metallopeptidase [Chroococcidiopsidaceae cyanobacterium CP_BM_RX_35]|nr:zinc metallopeptidase [Chroococcidiopsidaceae cyanobacterium CP_BM_RX_35]
MPVPEVTGNPKRKERSLPLGGEPGNQTRKGERVVAYMQLSLFDYLSGESIHLYTTKWLVMVDVNSFALFLLLIVHMRTKHHNPKCSATCGLTGFKIARKILDENGLPGLPIQNDFSIKTAFYRPQEGKQGTIHLPPHIYAGASLYAVAISAHECGHALQSYYGRSHFSSCRFALALFLLCIGTTLFLANAWVALVAGLSGLWWTIGTLQDESDATRRGISNLMKQGLIEDLELDTVKQYLKVSFINYLQAALLFAGIWFVVVSYVIGAD